MIRSFACTETQLLFHRTKPRRFPSNIHRTALRKLRMLHRATMLSDLRSPPGNRLEALKGSRKGQNSIRVNDRYRICFVWCSGDAFYVEVVDYHQG